MLSKSSTFHVSTRHVYEHELKHLPYHQSQNHRSQKQSKVDDPTPHSNQYTKHNQRQVLNSNMFRSEIMFNSKNFIVRVNQQNSSMVLTRVCPPTTAIRSLNKINGYLHAKHKDYIEDNYNKNQHQNVYLPIKHNLIEILPHDGYCLTGDKKMRLIFKSLIHLLEFYLLVQVSNRGSFLRLPSAICQAKTTQELDQINKQGIKFWKSTNNWNVDYKPFLKNPFLPNSQLFTSQNSMKSSKLRNQQDSNMSVNQISQQQTREYPRWRQMNIICNKKDNKLTTTTTTPRIRPRASSVNDRSTQHHYETKLKHKEIEKPININNNNKINHADNLFKTMKQRLDFRNNYLHKTNDNNSKVDRLSLEKHSCQQITNILSPSSSSSSSSSSNVPIITTTIQKISPLNKTDKINESIECSSLRLNQNRRHQNGVYEGAENEFWDALLQAKSSNPVQTVETQAWRSWNPNQNTKHPMNITNTFTGVNTSIIITTTTTAANTDTNNQSQEGKLFTSAFHLNSTSCEPTKTSTRSKGNTEYHDLNFPLEIVNSQDKKRQLKHQISLPSDRSHLTSDAYDKQFVLKTHQTTIQPVCMNLVNDSVGNSTTNAMKCNPIVHTTSNTSHTTKNCAGSICDDLKLPNYFTRIVNTNHYNDTVNYQDTATNPIYSSGCLNNELRVDTSFNYYDTNDNRDDNLQFNGKETGNIDKTLSDYDALVDQEIGGYKNTRYSLNLNDLATPQTVGHVFVMKATAYPIDEYNFSSHPPIDSLNNNFSSISLKCSTTTSTTTTVSGACYAKLKKDISYQDNHTPGTITTMSTINDTCKHKSNNNISEPLHTSNKPKLRRAYSLKKQSSSTSKRTQPYEDLLLFNANLNENNNNTNNSLDNDGNNDSYNRRHGLLFLGESSTCLRNNILPTDKTEKITRMYDENEADTTHRQKTVKTISENNHRPTSSSSPPLSSKVVMQKLDEIKNDSSTYKPVTKIIYSKTLNSQSNYHPDLETSDVTDTFVNHYDKSKKYDILHGDHTICFETDMELNKNYFQDIEQNSKVKKLTMSTAITMTATTTTALISETVTKSVNSECPTLTLLSAPRISLPHEIYQSEQNVWDKSSNSRQQQQNNNPHSYRHQISSDSQQNKSFKLESNTSSPGASSRASTVFCPPWDTAPIGPYIADLLKLNPPFSSTLDDLQQSPNAYHSNDYNSNNLNNSKIHSQSRNTHYQRKDSTRSRSKTLSSVEHQLLIGNLLTDYNNYYCSSSTATTTTTTDNNPVISPSSLLNSNNKTDMPNLFSLWEQQQQNQSNNRELKELSSTSLGNMNEFFKSLQNDFLTETTTAVLETSTTTPTTVTMSAAATTKSLTMKDDSDKLSPPLPVRSKGGLNDPYSLVNVSKNNSLDYKLHSFIDFTDDISPYAVTACHSMNYNNNNNNNTSNNSVQDCSCLTSSELQTSSSHITRPLNNHHIHGKLRDDNNNGNKNVDDRSNININTTTNITSNGATIDNHNTNYSVTNNADSTTIEELIPYDYSLSNKSLPLDFCQNPLNSSLDSTTSHGKIWPDNYVYAQVLPKHLRDQVQFTDINSFDHTITFRSDPFNDMPQMEFNNLKTLEHISLNKKDELTDKDSFTQQCIAPLSIGESLQTSSSTNSLASSFDSKTSLSSWNSSESYSQIPSKSEQYHLPLNTNMNNKLIHSINTSQLNFEKVSLLTHEQLQSSNNLDKINWSSDLPQKSKRVGRHIKKFFHRLMTNPKSQIAEQINLFIECTKASSDRGPYRTMQSIRQFINGMTNYLLKNPYLGLPKAVEREKKELNEFGYVNVGFHLESALQRYILKPLHLHVIKQLEQEQVKNTDLSNLQIKVQKLCDPEIRASDLGIQAPIAPPKESLIQYVVNVYSHLANTYSVQRKINYLVSIFNYIRKSIYNLKSDQELDANSLSTEDLHAYYAWVFARSGLLLTSLNPTNNHDIGLQTTLLTNGNNNINKSIICPAALQADYLDGVLNTPQLNDQATGLNDLFGSLYWIWNDKNALYQSHESSPLTQQKLLNTEQQNASSYSINKQESQLITQDESLQNMINSFNLGSSKYIPYQHKQDHSTSMENKNSSSSLFRLTTEFSRRRIIPPRRRKTVTGVNLPKIPNIEHSNEIKSSPTKIQHNVKHLTADSSMNTTRQFSNLSKPQSISHLTLNEDHFSPVPLNQNNNNNNTLSRWRPWIAQPTLLTHSPSTCPLPVQSSLSSTANLKMSSTSPVHANTTNCLQVLVMNEETNQLQALNYPIRPNMTARELNNLIAFQMRIFDSKDFGLFAYINGTEIQLEDELRIAEYTSLNPDISYSTHILPTTMTMVTPSRSQTGTPNSLKDHETLPFKSHVSISSHSDSTTSSSSDFRSRTVSHRTGKSNRNRAAWWTMCGSNGQSKHQLVVPVQDSACKNGTECHENLGLHKPVLVYKRKSGYFALSDRLLGSGLKFIQQQNLELSSPEQS
ncbi:unnamed protein product [Schistosoma haematobium]|nr:unnamed protein product [Schistosoma haematobium]